MDCRQDRCQCKPPVIAFVKLPDQNAFFSPVMNSAVVSCNILHIYILIVKWSFFQITHTVQQVIARLILFGEDRLQKSTIRTPVHSLRVHRERRLHCSLAHRCRLDRTGPQKGHLAYSLLTVEQPMFYSQLTLSHCDLVWFGMLPQCLLVQLLWL